MCYTMKRLIPILLLAILSIQAIAQDYACVLPAEKQYFIDSSHYLRGMRIDSVKTLGDTTIYYPFHTPRGNFGQGNTLDSSGGSWMGSKVIVQKEGTYWFINYWSDTVVIKSQAELNDKWMMYEEDTSGIYYEAEIIAIDTATVLGSLDSIKTISITAYDKNGVAANAPAHGIQWQLSKTHGFYKVWDIYMFPYHYPNDNSTGLHQYEDYYTYKLNGFRAFTLVDFKNPKETEVYDYGVGDIFYTLDLPVFSPHWDVKRYYDSVLSVNTTANKKEYSIQRIYSYPYSSQGNIYHKLDTGVIMLNADTSFFVKEFPEEFGNNYIYYYYPNDTGHCKVSDVIKRETNQLTSGGRQVNIWLDVRLITWRYKVGVGLVAHDSWKALSLRFEAFDRDLMFYRINGVDCGGIIFPLSTSGIAKAVPDINIYPNPASGNTVHIDVPSGGLYEMTVYDVVGKEVSSAQLNGSYSIDVSGYTSGLYLFVIKGADGSIHQEKVSVL